MNPTRILLADDHAMLLDALQKVLEPKFQVVGAVTNGRALIDAAEKLWPDVIVADISMPQLNGLDACERIIARFPDTKFIVLTMDENPAVAEEAIRRGAMGYVLKKSAASELLEAIQQVLRGRNYVSPALSRGMTAHFVSHARSGDPRHALSLRQREVLQLLAEGQSMKQVAEILKITARTVAFHKYSMMELLGCKTSAELVQHAVRMDLVSAKPSQFPRQTSQR